MKTCTDPVDASPEKRLELPTLSQLVPGLASLEITTGGVRDRDTLRIVATRRWYRRLIPGDRTRTTWRLRQLLALTLPDGARAIVEVR